MIENGTERPLEGVRAVEMGSLLAGPFRGQLLGNYIVIGANADTVFGCFAKALGHPEWAGDERYATRHTRGEHQEELDEKISAWTRKRGGDEVLEVMAEAGVPAGKVFTAEDMLEDPHYAARENIVPVKAPRDRRVPHAERRAAPDRDPWKNALDRSSPRIA